MIRSLALALAPVALVLLVMAAGGYAEQAANGRVVIDGLLLAVTVAALAVAAVLGAFVAAVDATERAA